MAEREGDIVGIVQIKEREIKHERDNYRTAPHGRSYVVFTNSVFYNDMDVDVYMDIIPLEVSYRDQIKVYIIQIICWSVFI